MRVTLHGIPNCDTVKKARAWLANRGVAVDFHDYRKLGADPATIARWIGQVGLDRVLNKAGTTFRKLPDELKADLDADKAIALMASHPSCIKRPIVAYGDDLLVGFKPDEWDAALG